ncbi:hypothetical protein CXG81DRAFT_24518 [Caulochytrium protostelioides]|uniref:Uncharacterized protein n=1 Tax=Caulochytrium protostelioides TaxID=1555241 RepID=A0A4V1IV49_9FUNG|nr:hypothetical protein CAUPRSCDRAFT_10365 [Caulochytrium protostelioides]RKP02819.1 hypothetical protein CXG81DRAFT_24518 [Caulochytrium protostelioides]|eukprot:RKP02819.1 hypothetical protein CXG81DRAFT_24518 [Caulochytrium protostelioides]
MTESMNHAHHPFLPKTYSELPNADHLQQQRYAAPSPGPDDNYTLPSDLIDPFAARHDRSPFSHGPFNFDMTTTATARERAASFSGSLPLHYEGTMMDAMITHSPGTDMDLDGFPGGPIGYGPATASATTATSDKAPAWQDPFAPSHQHPGASSSSTEFGSRRGHARSQSYHPGMAYDRAGRQALTEGIVRRHSRNPSVSSASAGIQEARHDYTARVLSRFSVLHPNSHVDESVSNADTLTGSDGGTNSNEFAPMCGTLRDVTQALYQAYDNL